MTSRMTLEDYMTMPWTPVVRQAPDGSFRLTVEPLKDFEIFGPKELVEAEWETALKGYLRACLATQKAIPLPATMRVDNRDSGILLTWDVPGPRSVVAA